MSENSKELRELLIELEYGELDKLEAAAVQDRIDADPSMKAMQVVFQAVRAEMHAGEEIEMRPARIAFVAMPGQVGATNGSTSMLWKGLAVAASFVFGLLLAAAAVNTAGLWPVAPGDGVSSPGGAPLQTTPIAEMSDADVADLENFLDARYARRDATNITPVSTMNREQLQPIIDDLMAEREGRLRQVMRQMLAVAEDQQRQEIETMMAGMFQTFDSQRTNDMLAVADELGILQQNTGLELQQHTDALDYLFTRVGTGREQNDD
jgi:hypothetical protein